MTDHQDLYILLYIMSVGAAALVIELICGVFLNRESNIPYRLAWVWPFALLSYGVFVPAARLTSLLYRGWRPGPVGYVPPRPRPQFFEQLGQDDPKR